MMAVTPYPDELFCCRLQACASGMCPPTGDSASDVARMAAAAMMRIVERPIAFMLNSPLFPLSRLASRSRGEARPFVSRYFADRVSISPTAASRSWRCTLLVTLPLAVSTPPVSYPTVGRDRLALPAAGLPRCLPPTLQHVAALVSDLRSQGCDLGSHPCDLRSHAVSWKGQ